MIATLGRFAREQIVELAAAAAAAAFLLSGRITWERATRPSMQTSSFSFSRCGTIIASLANLPG